MPTDTHQRETITKKELIDRIADSSRLKRTDVRTVVQSFLDELIDEVGKGNRLEFRDFGVFEVRERKARLAQNPKTLEPVEVPARSTVKFKVGRRMQQALDALDNPDQANPSTVNVAPVKVAPKPRSITFDID